MTECQAVNRVLISALRHFVCLGGDAVPVVLCWLIFMAAMVRLTVLPIHALPLFLGGFWLVVLCTRQFRALRGQPEWAPGYYLCRVRLWIVNGTVLLLSGLIVWWYGNVAEFGLVKLYIPSLLLLLPGGIPRLAGTRWWLCAWSSTAFVLGCAAPACFYSFRYSLFAVLTEPGFWLLVTAFYLFFVERLQDEESGKVGPGLKSVLVIAALMGCLYAELQLPTLLPGIYMTAATSLCAVWLYIMLRPRLSAKIWFAIGWPLMALPTLPWVAMYLLSGSAIVW